MPLLAAALWFLSLLALSPGAAVVAASSLACLANSVPVWGDLAELSSSEVGALALSPSSSYTYEGDGANATSFSEHGAILRWLISDFFHAPTGEHGSCMVSLESQDEDYYGLEHQDCLWTEYAGNGYSVRPCCDVGGQLCPQYRESVDLAIQENGGVCCAGCATGDRVAYAKTVVYADSAADVSFTWGVDDAGLLWLNGALVASKMSCTGSDTRQTLSVSLMAGYNTIVTKVRDNVGSGDYFSIFAAIDPAAIANYGLEVDIGARLDSCGLQRVDQWADVLAVDGSLSAVSADDSTGNYLGQDIAEDGKVIQWLISRQIFDWTELDSDCQIFEEPRDGDYVGTHDDCLWTTYFGNGYSELPCCASGDCPRHRESIDLAIQDNDGQCCWGCARGKRVAYAKTFLSATSAGTTWIRWSSNDAGMLFVNGVLVHTRSACGKALEDNTDDVLLSLNTGKNEIVIKLSENESSGDDFGLLFLVTTDDVARLGLSATTDSSTSPTATPTSSPTLPESQEPSWLPTASPSENPSALHSISPSEYPTTAPSPEESSAPSAAPSSRLTSRPSASPTSSPTRRHSDTPTLVHSAMPSGAPSVAHSLLPSAGPSSVPTVVPSKDPTLAPTFGPTTLPTALPTWHHSGMPTEQASLLPTTSPSTIPSDVPSAMPSTAPTVSGDDVLAIISNLPQVVDACDTIRADASLSVGVGLRYDWSVTSSRGDVLLVQNDQGSLLLLPATLLAESIGDALTVHLDIQDTNGKRDGTELAFSISPSSVPLVTINGGSIQTIGLDRGAVVLTGQATLPSGCAEADADADADASGAASSMNYEWTLTQVVDSTGVAVDSDALLQSADVLQVGAAIEIPSARLAPGWMYDFVLKAEYVSNSTRGVSTSAEGTASTRLKVRRRDLSVRIAGGGYQEITTEQNSSLLCIGEDPDYPSEPLGYSWSCDLASPGLFDVNVAERRIYVHADDAAANSSFVCNCTVHTGEYATPATPPRSSSVEVAVRPPALIPRPTVTLLTRVDGNSPEMVASEVVANSDDFIGILALVEFQGTELAAPGDDVTAEWIVLDPDGNSVPTVASDAFELILEPNALATGAVYDIAVLITPLVDNSGPASAGVRVRINQGPTSGVVALGLEDESPDDPQIVVIEPLLTEVAISLVGAEDPDGVDAFQFSILGCDTGSNTTSSGIAVPPSGAVAGSSSALSQYTSTNKLTTFLPSGLVVCSEHVEQTPGAEFDTIVIGATARDSLGASETFTAGIRVRRAPEASPTASPTGRGSSAPTVVSDSSNIDCQTSIVEAQRLLRNGEGILTLTWMVAETTRNTWQGESAHCKRELLLYVQEALSLNLEAPADLACQTMNAIVYSTDVVNRLEDDVLDLALDLVTQTAQAAATGLEDDVGYDVFSLLDCLLTTMEFYSASRVGAEEAFLSAYAFIHQSVSIALLRQMVPGQQALSVDAESSTVVVEAASEKAANADLLTFRVGNASITLPANISLVVQTASETCAELVDDDYDVDDLGFLGSLRSSSDSTQGGGLTILLTICAGLSDLLGSPAASGLLLDLSLDAPESTRARNGIFLGPGTEPDEDLLVSMSTNVSVACATANAPYNVSIPCPDEELSYECSGEVEGTVDVQCPVTAFVGSCERRVNGTWTSAGCEFLGLADDMVLCQCEIGDAGSGRRLQEDEDDDGDQEIDSLDFASRFEEVGSGARYTFTETGSITADDAARASIVLIAMGSLIIAYILGLGLGHRMDKQERTKRKSSMAPESARIREAMHRIPVELDQDSVLERQLRILGPDAFRVLGKAEGRIGDTCSRMLLFCVDLLFPQKASLLRQRSLEKVVQPMTRAKIHPGLSNKTSLQPSSPGKRGKKRSWFSFQQAETKPARESPARDTRDSWIGFCPNFEELKHESRRHNMDNPMRGRAEAVDFAVSYDLQNQVYESMRNSFNDDSTQSSSEEDRSSDVSQGNGRRVPLPKWTDSGYGSNISAGMLQPLFRMRSTSFNRKSSFLTSGMAGTTKDPINSPLADAPGSKTHLERLDFIMAELEDEVHDMQKMRKNFQSALLLEHEVFSIFRFNPTDRTIDDVYNEQAQGVPFAQALSARRLSDTILRLSEMDESYNNGVVYHVSGSGIWARAKNVWSNATRPQKITLLFLQLLTIMAVDALFYTGSEDLIVTANFWSDLGSGNTSDLAKNGVAVILFALLTAVFALPPTAFSLGIYSIKREMRAAETVARRILLHAESGIVWKAQLSPSNSASDYAIALLETLAILQLAQNQEFTDAVVPLQRQAAALETLRNVALTKEMTVAADIAASGVDDVEEGGPNRMLELMSEQKWQKRRKAASEACDRAARKHEEEVRDGLAVLMTPAERQRVDMDNSAKRVLEAIEHMEEAKGKKPASKKAAAAEKQLQIDTFGFELAEGVAVVLDKREKGGVKALRHLFPKPSTLYDEWVSTFSRPSIHQLAQSYKCPITNVNAGSSCFRKRDDSLIRLGRRRKKFALASFYAMQALWGGFCILYVLLFALTRSEVATAWFFSWIVATIFEVLYVSPIIIFAAHALAPATVGIILERSLDSAKNVIATGSACATDTKRKVQTSWRAGE